MNRNEKKDLEMTKRERNSTPDYIKTGCDSREKKIGKSYIAARICKVLKGGIK